VSAGYRAVGWNRQKCVYDLVLAFGVLLYVALFVGAGRALHPGATSETLVIRAFGTLAFLLLHVVLTIGPLCRLDRRFLPLLYNRRHLGVVTFLCGAVHGLFSLVQFHALGDVHPLVSLLVSNARIDSLSQFPFQPLGFAALAILFLMAATSHDFWLANLSAPVWKALHMLVYGAWALVVAHVLLGVLQAETDPLFAALVAAGVAWVVGLHLLAAFRERGADRIAAGPSAGFVEVCGVDDIPEARAHVACLSGERVAVFRYAGRLSAVSGVCQHQNGPLGEGKVLDGCITCPWHGYQYLPETGASPPPFTERVPTFRVEIRAGRVWVDPRPLPPGTRVEPARVATLTASATGGPHDDEFYVGYLPQAPPVIASRTGLLVVGLLGFAAALALALAARQRPFDPGVFEFGVAREFAGLAIERPFPALWVERPGGAVSRYDLVAAGKHGAAALVAGLDERAVRLRGSLIYREGRSMIEVEAGSLAAAGDPVSAARLRERLPSLEDLGARTLVGEIVDTKCFLGVMKPGRSKPHKSCAIRCISGGIPPALVVQDEAGRTEWFLLAGRDGRALNREVLEFVAEPVEIRGRVERQGDLLVLRAEPSDYRRLAR
jgi:nitrite reductase/ring-hydroxylating ferredoxin subunit/DMSO/TMAO reductase YedYZ heme-binding membrane subunit